MNYNRKFNYHDPAVYRELMSGISQKDKKHFSDFYVSAGFDYGHEVYICAQPAYMLKLLENPKLKCGRMQSILERVRSGDSRKIWCRITLLKN